MIDFDEVALKLAKAEADNKALKAELDRTKNQLEAAKTLITEIKVVMAEQDLEPQDQYAEQRKWIGKLGWFWDNDDGETESCGLLDEINKDNCRPFASYFCGNWKHCKPVKPDDDIIYKGDDND